MGNVKQNAYHVKLKLIPKDKDYKSSFVQGIVFEMNPSLAEKMALEKLQEWNETDANVKCDIKVQSIVKLRKDFMFHPESKSNDSN